MKSETAPALSGDGLLSPRDLAQQAQVSVTVVRRLIWAGALPAVRVGRLVRVRLADWQAYLEAHRVRGRGEWGAVATANNNLAAGRPAARQ
jgi:excisionase family DNA binding protein